MEFLVSGTKSEAIFCRDQIENLKRIVEAGQILQDKQRNVLFKKLDMVNDVPLMEKIRIMEQEFDVKLTKEEDEILRSTRNKRNYLIHGKKDIDITESELNKLRSIIELLLIGKIRIM